MIIKINSHLGEGTKRTRANSSHIFRFCASHTVDAYTAR